MEDIIDIPEPINKNKETQDELLLKLIEKEFVLFCPKSERALKMEYPELAEYSEFGDLGDSEMRFVWAWCCDTSPFLRIPEDKRLEECAKFAFKEQALRASRFETYKSGFPEDIKRAIRRMSTFNAIIRIEEMVYITKVRENCKISIAQDMNNMLGDEEQIARYWMNVSRAQKQLVETRYAVERGALGISEAEDTKIESIKDSLAEYHKNLR
ncbi:MAG TPA: hypothetical protein PLE71_17240 [Flavobacteriales bacterium]|nr:hypothetical protein [Flavobacteriales bacterium]HRA18537.1 hypothetical protein [Flavobacteriales bacterium]